MTPTRADLLARFRALATHAQAVGDEGTAVFDRIAKAGGAHGLVTIAEVEAIATVTCAEQAAQLVERPISVVRRTGK